MFSFRERFHLGDRVRIAEAKRELALTTQEDAPESVFLAALTPTSISEAADLALTGGGFRSKVDAVAAGEKWKSYLRYGLARRYVGAEFGTADPDAGRFLGESDGTPLLSDRPGLIIHETEPRPAFLHLASSGVRKQDPANLVTAVQAARAMDLPQSQSHSVAFDLFGMSFSPMSNATRLVTLMMAVETVINQKPHPAEVLQLIDEFVTQTADSSIPENLKSSLLGSLRQIRMQSVGQAGKQLASSTLSGRKYQGLEPAKFFQKCYTLRSKIVHGDLNQLDQNEVNSAGGHLELFVGDLLSAPLLHLAPD